MSDSAETAALLNAAAKWQCDGAQVAVAVVVNAWNSAPRPPGARMLVRQDGHVAGSVSGGCVEKEVIYAALECLRENAPRLLSFGVADETAWRAGLTCGGAIEVLVLPLPSVDTAAHGEITKLRAALAARKSGALQTHTHTGALHFDDCAAAAPAAMRGALFVEYFAPPRRAVIVGAVHIAQELIPVLAACGFAATVIDPRRAWATPERFPSVQIDTRWPDEVLAEMQPDFQTAVIALTHDPKIDDPALLFALRAKTGYIGALGSRRTHDKRRQRLAAAGIDETSLARIHAPIGANIGAKTAAEIAVSVAAELVSFYRRD